MVTRLSYAIVCFALTLPAGAQTPAARAAAEAARWEARFEAVAAYDNLAGPQLRDSDGRWKEPKRATVAILEALAPEIRRVAALYHVDPRAIVGAILTENSLNVQADDTFQDWLVSSGVLSTGQIGGRAMTVGLGQINVPTARNVEALAARIEHRTARSDAVIAQALLRPGDAIRYAAAIMRQAQDAYEAAGFDISREPAILATVYNLGRPTQLAAAAQAGGRTPRVNYFGFFVEHYMSRIERITRSGTDLVGGTTLATSSAPVADAAATEAKAPPVVNAASLPPTPATSPQRVITREVRLLVSPSTCDTIGTGRVSEYNRINSLSTYASSGRATAGHRYTVVSPGLGCDMEPYTLIRADNGTVGWVANDVLQARSEERMLPVRTCTRTTDTACSQAVERALGNQRIEGTTEGETAVRIVGTGTGLNWHYTLIGGVYNGTISSAALVSRRAITSEEAAHFAQALRARIQQVLDILNRRPHYEQVGYWVNDTNPYSFAYSQVDNIISTLERCIPTAGRGPALAHCVADVDAINHFLEFEVRPAPSFSYLAGLANTCKMEVSASVQPPSEAVVAALRRELLQLIAPCQTLVNGRSISAATFSGIKTSINGDITGNEDLERLRQNFSALGTDCTNIQDLLTGAALTGAQRDDDIYCSRGSSFMGSARFRVSGLRPFLITPEDQDQFINGVLMNAAPDYIFNGSGPSNSGSDDTHSFTYDPFATAELIERILRNRCVKAVYVPDPWLMRRLRSQTRVIYRPMTEEDRFTVEVGTTTCTEGSAAR